jgi:hypothetical protein
MKEHVTEQGKSDVRYTPHILLEDTDQPGLLAVRYLGKYVDTNSVHRDQISGTCSTHGEIAQNVLSYLAKRH